MSILKEPRCPGTVAAGACAAPSRAGIKKGDAALHGISRKVGLSPSSGGKTDQARMSITSLAGKRTLASRA